MLRFIMIAIVMICAHLKLVLTGTAMDFRLVYTLLINGTLILKEVEFSKKKPYCGPQSLECLKLDMAVDSRNNLKTANILMALSLLLFPLGETWWIHLLLLNAYAFILLPGNISARTYLLYEKAGRQKGEISTYELPHWHSLHKKLQQQLLEAQYKQPPVLGRPRLVVKKRFTKTLCIIYLVGEKDHVYCPENENMVELMPILEPYRKKTEDSSQTNLELYFLKRGD